MAPRLIVLDWGTSSLRAYLLGDGGRVLDTLSAALGILKVADNDFDSAFEQVCGTWFAAHGDRPVLACGMIGARQGWREARYAPCPAGLAEISAQLVHFSTKQRRRFAIVPGLSFEAVGVPDVMRGEETQIFGALEPEAIEQRLFVLPGTHSKWAVVQESQVQSFATFMTGEVFALLSEHSILGRPMTDKIHDAASFDRGCRYAMEDGDEGALLHQLFSARTLNLMNRLASNEIHAYLSGLLIGSEVNAATRRFGTCARAATIVGDSALCEHYRRALALAAWSTHVADPSVTPNGLWRIACAANLLS
jgi:2-dehydro-3-deoxygalactonokinase